MPGHTRSGSRTIWVLAGTGEARRIAASLADRGLDVVATVTTEAGRELLTRSSANIRPFVGMMEVREMRDFITGQGIDFVLDATHPFAAAASANAIASVNGSGIPYLRFERPGAAFGDNVTWADDFEEAARLAAAYGSTIFLTVGSRRLAPFVREARAAGAALVARVLDDPYSGELVRALGLSHEEVIYFGGELDEEWASGQMEAAGASCVVMKDSGEQGGAGRKLAAARRLGIPAIVIRRPKIEYPRVVREIDAAIREVEQWAAS